MKKIKITLFVALLAFFFASCETDINKVEISSDPTAPVMGNVTINSADFNADNAANVINFSWSAADFGFKASVNYTVQMDVAGNNFADAVDLVSSYTTSASATVKDINKKLLDMNLEPDVAVNLEFRVAATINDNVSAQNSNTMAASVTPYQTSFEPIYMIGAALQGWDLAFAVEVPGIAKGVYEVTTKFTKGGNFRFFPAPDWSSSWGYDFFTGTVTDLLSPALSDSDPNYNFNGGTGDYKITINFNDKSIAMELVGDVQPEQPQDYTFGIIGTAYEINGIQANWDNDFMFTYASNNGDVYTYSIDKITLLADGEFKVRKDKDWVVSYGYSDVTIEGDPTNFVDNGGNIKVVATKTYSVDFVLDVANNTQKLVFTERGEYPPAIWLVGSINGWNNHGQYMEAVGNDVHVGYQYLNDAAEIKFLIARDSWDGLWGAGAAGGEIADGGDNIKVIDVPTYTDSGFYEIKADLANGTLVLTPITVMGVIGDAQAGGWDTDVDLTYNGTTKMWEGQVPFIATGAYKFRANHAWDISFGGTLDNLTTQNGANIDTPGEGTYNVSLDLSGADAFTATVSQ